MSDLLTTPFTWPTGDGPSIGEDVVVPSVLLYQLALNYHTLHYRGSIASEQASRDLLLRLRPVNDGDLGRWMDALASDSDDEADARLWFIPLREPSGV